MSLLLQLTNWDADHVAFPWKFTIYVILFALVVLYYLLLSPNARALLIVGPLQKWMRWALGPDQSLSIKGIGFAILSGKIYLNHIEYRTKNICVRILQSTVRINWWFGEVRESDSKHDERLPCRLSFEFVGFEYIIYHNSYAYDHLSELIFGAAGVDLKKELDGVGSDDDLFEDEPSVLGIGDTARAGRPASTASSAPPPKPRRTPLPMFYRFFPVTKVTVKSLSIMVGNLKLPNFLVLTTSSAHLLHSTGRGVSVHASYQSLTEVTDITNSAIYLQRNTAYTTPDELVRIKKELDQEDYFVIAIETMSKIFQENAGGGANATKVHSERVGGGGGGGSGGVLGSGATSAKRRKNLDHGIQMTDLHSSTTTGIDAEDNGIGLGFETDRDEAADRKKEKSSSSSSIPSHDREYILQCAEFNIEYSYDIASPLTEFDISWFASHLKAVPHHAAKQRLRFEFVSKTQIQYGPWTDHQRALMMSLFKPWDYRNQKVYVPKIDEPWPYTSLVIEAVWRNEESNLRMPYRDLTRIMPALGLAADATLPDSYNTPLAANQFIEVTFASESWLSYDLGWCVLQEDAGSNTLIKANLQHAVLWTPLPSQSTLSATHSTVTPIFQPLIESELCEISCNLNYPTLWNDLTHWTFTFNFHTSKLWYHSNHIDFFKTLFADWAKYNEMSAGARKVGGRSLSYFVPSVMQYTILLTEYEILLNVNENNVVKVREYHPPQVDDPNTLPPSSSLHPHGRPNIASLFTSAGYAECPLPASAAIQPPIGFGTINNLDDNTYIIIRGPDLLVKLLTPYKDFHARSSEISYDVTARNLRAHLSLPKNHPLQELIETRNAMQFLYINNLNVRSTYIGHYKYNPDYRDSHRIGLSIEGGEADFFGHFIRPILNLKANYIGDTMNWIDEDEYRKYGHRNILGWLKQIKYYEGSSGPVAGSGSPDRHTPGIGTAASRPAAPSIDGGATGASWTRGNSFEERNASEMYFSLLAENIALNLPLYLFTNPNANHQPKIRCYTIQLEVRSIQQYFDIMLSLAPLTVTIPIPPSSPLMQIIRAPEDDTTSLHRNRSWNEKETFIHVKDLTFSWHQSKGDLPRMTVYRSLMKIGIEAILVQLFPQQLLTFVTCINNFMEQYKEVHDHTIVSGPTNDTVQLPTFDHHNGERDTTRRETPEEIQIKGEMASFLADLLLTNKLADVGMELNVGDVQFHLLHPPLPVTALTVSRAHQVVAEANLAGNKRSTAAAAAAAATGGNTSGAGTATAANELPNIPPLPTAHLSLTRILLPQGFQISTSSLITPQSHSKMTTEVPGVDISYLICTDLRPSSGVGASPRSAGMGIPNLFRVLSDNVSEAVSPRVAPGAAGEGDHLSRWVALCQIRLGLTLTQADQRSDWLSAMRKQQDFIYSQMHHEGPIDDSEAYTWHESNATKVPYVLVDEVAINATPGFAEYQLHQPTPSFAQLHTQSMQQIGGSNGNGIHPSVYVPSSHHQRPRFYRTQHSSASVASLPHSNSTASELEPAVTIEDELDEKDDTVDEELPRVAEDDRSVSPNAHSDSESIAAPTGRTPHYLSHIRQRSLQISRGPLHLRRSALTMSGPLHSRSISSSMSTSPAGGHSRHILTPPPAPTGPTLHSRNSSLPFLASHSREGHRSDEFPSGHAIFTKSTSTPVFGHRRHTSASTSLSHAQRRIERSTTSRTSIEDEDGEDVFESCIGLEDDDDESATRRMEEQDDFHDFSQVEGMPHHPSTRFDFDPPHASTPISPMRHLRSHSGGVGVGVLVLPGDSAMGEVRPIASNQSAASAHSQTHEGSHMHFAEYVSPLPTADLQAYLEHYALDGGSHAFVQGARDRRGLGGVHSALHHPFNKPTVSDVALAGTSAGAFLSLPLVGFESLSSVNEDDTNGCDQPYNTNFPNNTNTNDFNQNGPAVSEHLPGPITLQHAVSIGSTASAAAATNNASMPAGVARRVVIDASTEGILPAPTPHVAPSSIGVAGLTGVRSALPTTRDRSHSVSQGVPKDVGGPPSGPVGPSGLVTMETIHTKHQIFNTSKTVLEFTSDVTLMLCPAFIANMDQYLPFLQAGYTTVEDTLDELHMQFTKAFNRTAEPVPNTHTAAAPTLQPDTEMWHTASVQRSIILPRLYMEFLQSSVSSLDPSYSSASISGLAPSRRGIAQPNREPKPVIYATTISIEGVTANIAQSYPLPTTYTNHATGVSLTNSKPLPSAQGQISMNKLHAYSCILNPPRYCGHTDSSSTSPLVGTRSVFDSPRSTSSGHVHSSTCWGPNSIAIPHQELKTLLPPAILSTSAVFVSIELNNAVVSMHHSTTTEMNPLYVKPVVAQVGGGFASAAAAAAAAAAAPSDDVPPGSPGGPPLLTRQNTVLWHERSLNERAFHAHQPSLSTLHVPMTVPPLTPTSPVAPPTRVLRPARLTTSTPMVRSSQDALPTGAPSLQTGSSTTVFSDDGTGVGRSFSFAVDDGRPTIFDDAALESDDSLDSPVGVPPPIVKKASYFLNTTMPATMPSPSSLNAFTHSHSSLTRIHVDNVACLSGWDAPSRIVTVTRDWVTAFGQLEFLAVLREWIGDSGLVLAAQEEDATASEADSAQSSGDSSIGTDGVSSKKPTVKQVANPALALFATLPGGPATALRRNRWQTLLTFALQHVVHSRALDENRGGSKAFGEIDQLRLLQWVYHRVRHNIGAYTTRPNIGSDDHDYYDEIGVMLANYGMLTSPNSIYPPRHSDTGTGTGIGIGTGIPPDDFNFIQSRAAPLTLALRKLLKLPPSLMRRLNFKLQRSDDLQASSSPVGNSALGNVGAPTVQIASNGDIDFVKLYENDKLEASDLARLTLQVFALLAPQAAKVRVIERPADLSPALWQSVNHMDYHRSEVDQRQVGVEWEVMRVRVRVTHAPSTAKEQETSQPSAHRDHAISINSIFGIASITNHNSFTRVAVPARFSTRGAMPSVLQLPRDPPSGTPIRASVLMRGHASRSLVRDTATSGPSPNSSKMSVTVSPPTPLSNASHGFFSPPASNMARAQAHTKPSPTMSTWMRDREFGGGRPMSLTIAEGREDMPSASPVATHTPRAPLSPTRGDFTSPVSSASPLAPTSPTNFPLANFPSAASHYQWCRLEDGTCTANAADLLIDVGPDIHRFLASLSAATFVFADIHEKNVQSARNAARRMKNQAASIGGGDPNDPIAVFEREQAAAKAAASIAASSHSLPVALAGVYCPRVTSNYFFQSSVDTIGIRARVPGTAALHIVTHGTTIAVASFKPLGEAEFEARHRKQKAKSKSKDKKPNAATTSGAAAMAHAATKVAPQVAAFSRSLGVGGTRLGVTGESNVAGDDDDKSTLPPPFSVGIGSSSSSSDPSGSIGGGETRMTSLTVKMDTLDLRLMDQDTNDASIDDDALAAQLQAAAVNSTATSGVNARTGKKKGTVLLSLFLRLFAFNMDQTLWDEACEKNRQLLAAQSSDQPTPITTARHISIGDRTDERPYRPHAHSAAPPVRPTPHTAHPPSIGSSISSTMTSVTGSSAQRMMVVINSEQSIFTLPFHHLEKLHVHDYIDPWKPIVAVFNANSALDEAKELEEAEANAARLAAEATQAEGYTSAAFAWMRGEVKKTPIETKAQPTNTISTVSSYLSSSTSAATHTHWSILVQLRGVSVVMLPLPSVMFTYHLDRIYVKLTSPMPAEFHLLLSIGLESDRPPGQPIEPRDDDNTISSHKITLHSANVKKKRPNSHNDSDYLPPSTTDRPSSARHPLEKGLGGNSRAKGAKYLSASLPPRDDRRSPTATPNMAQHHSPAPNKMQFVLEFRLPTVRASLRIRDHHIKGSAPEAKHTDDPNTSATSRPTRPVVVEDDDSSSDFSDGSNSSSHSSAVSSSDLSDSDGRSRSRSASPHQLGRRFRMNSLSTPQRRRARRKSDILNAQSSTAKGKSGKQPNVLTEIDGLIAVGSMTNHLDENVLSRLLHLQSTLNTEVNQLLDKFAQYSKDAGLDDGGTPLVGSVGGRRSSSSGASKAGESSRRSSINASPEHTAQGTPAVTTRGLHSKRLSTLDDLSIGVHHHHNHSHGEPLSPISRAFRGHSTLGSDSRSPFASTQPPPAAHLKLHPLVRRTVERGSLHSSKGVDDAKEKDKDKGNMWDRYAFNVNFAFENIHVTAGLSPKKTAIPMPKHIVATSPRMQNAQTFRNQTPSASTTTIQERAAQYQPILHVMTGTFSLSMRYRPKSALKLSSPLLGSAAPVNAAQTDPPSASASASASSSSVLPSKSLSKSDDSSNVIVEMVFHGIGLKMSTLAKHPTNILDGGLFAALVDGTNAATNLPRRTLIECRGDIKLRVGFKVNATYTHADCTLDQTLMKITAIPITTASLHVLTSTYMRAYAEFEIERARLVQDKEIRDPLIGLRALNADRVWSHIQSLPAIKNTISAATAHSTPTQPDAPHPHQSHPTPVIDTSMDVTNPIDLLSPTSAASAVAVQAAQENPNVGTGSMVILNHGTATTGTKYEMHFCMQATELVLLFEKNESRRASKQEEFLPPYDPSNPFGQFHPLAYDLSGYNPDPLHSGLGVGWKEMSSPAALGALVIFLDELDIKLDYAPPSNAIAIPRFTLGQFPSVLMARPPVNSLGASIEVTGLELACLSEDIADTNLLDDLASTLRKYRARPTATHARHAAHTETRFDEIDAATLSPHDDAYMKKYPFRSFSLHTAQSDSDIREARSKHVYNRIVLQSTVFQVRGALPATQPSHEELLSAHGSATHSRHRSQQWSGTIFTHAQAQALSHAAPLPPNKELTLVIDTRCTGAELDIDPSLVTHLSNLANLVQLFSDAKPTTASAPTNTTAAHSPMESMSPRGSIIDADLATGATGPDAGILVSPDMRSSRRPHSASSTRTLARSNNEDDARRPASSGNMRARSIGNRRAFRRKSLTAVNMDIRTDSSDDVDDDDVDDSSLRPRRSGRASGVLTPVPPSGALPSSPPPAATGGATIPLAAVSEHATNEANTQPNAATQKVDYSIEFKLNIDHGRCCLHPLPKKNEPTETSTKTSQPTTNATPTSVEDDVYADFVLPSISSILVVQSVPKEEILLLLDLNLPPLSLNPSLLNFITEVRLQMELLDETMASEEGAPHEFAADSARTSRMATPNLYTRGLSNRWSLISKHLDDPDHPPPRTADEAKAKGGLAAFIASCAVAGRSITVNVRISHTYVKLNCMPMNDQVYMQFGNKRAIDMCFTFAALDQQKLQLPVSIPYISCTVNIPVIFVQLGLINPVTGASSGPTFLDVRCRHTKFQLIEAFNIRSDAAPIRTVLFNIEHIAPAVITMNVVVAFVVFSKVWLIQSAVNKNTTGGVPGEPHVTDPDPITVQRYTAPRASYYYLSIGRIDGEVNMLDVLHVHNRSTFSMSRLSSRILDVGGCFPEGCYPLMAALDTGELIFTAESESGGLDGKFICATGIAARFCRLPLQSVHRTSFDFLAPAHEDTDSEHSVQSASDDDGNRRRARSQSIDTNTDSEVDYDGAHGWTDDGHGDDEDTYSEGDVTDDASAPFRRRRAHTKPVNTMQLMSRQGKAMVNMLEIHISDTTSHFHYNHGLTPLLVLHSSMISVSLLDQWNDRIDGVGYLDNDGDWCVKLYVDIGERLTIEASSRAIPYLLEIITHLIAFTQNEFKRIELSKDDGRTPFGRHRRLRSIGAGAAPTLTFRRQDTISQPNKGRGPLSPTSPRAAPPNSPPPSQAKPLRAGLLSLRGEFLEARLGSDVLAREFVCVEVHDFSVSLQRSLFYSPPQLKEQGQLLQLKRKRQSSLAPSLQRDAALFSDVLPGISSAGVIEPESITTEEELAVAIALLDEETDPLKRLKKRSNEPYRGGLLRPFTPMDVYRTLLIDIGDHRKVTADNHDQYMWLPDPTRPPRTYISQLGATGPGIYVSRLSQGRGDGYQDDLDHIFRIPGFVLEMETLDPLEQSTMRSRFLTFWDKSITVAIDVRVYKLLQSMALAFVDHLTRAKSQMELQAAEAQALANKAIMEALLEAEKEESQEREEKENEVAGQAKSKSPALAIKSAAAPGSAKRSVRFNLDLPSSGPPNDQTDGTKSAKVDSTTASTAFAASNSPTTPSPVPALPSSASSPPSGQLIVKSGSADKSLAPSKSHNATSPNTRTQHRTVHTQRKHSDGTISSKPPSVPAAPKLHKPFAVDSHYDLNNPAIHVLDHASSSGGISVRKIIDIMQSLNSNLKAKDLMKEEKQLIPAATHEVTEVLDQVLDRCVAASKAIDEWFEAK